MDKLRKALKRFAVGFMDILSAIFLRIEDFSKKNEVGPKMKSFAEESREKVKEFSETSSGKFREELDNVRAGRQTSPNQSSPDEVNVNRLGYFLDGWAELVEGMGDKADEVREETFDRLELKQMPDVEVKEQFANVGFSFGKRTYIFSETYPGATTAIYIGKHGKDLYVSWRTWLAAKLNTFLILILLGVATLGGYFSFGTREVGGFLFSPSYTETWAFGWSMSSLVILLLEVWLVSFAGRLIKGNPFAFFFIEPNVFDAEDITAMSLSAHYAILRALDHIGIDTSKLRIKEKFTAGRRGEDI